MQLVARCPFCKRVVDRDQSTCPHCAARLTKARFSFSSVLFYGLLALIVALIVSLVVVPATVLGIVFALFSREKLHLVNFEDHSGNGPDDSSRVVDTTADSG